MPRARLLLKGLATAKGKPSGKLRPGSQIRGRAEGNRSEGDAPFDLWLEQRLREAFADVPREPIPPELVALIETHRRKMSIKPHSP